MCGGVEVMLRSRIGDGNDCFCRSGFVVYVCCIVIGYVYGSEKFVGFFRFI